MQKENLTSSFHPEPPVFYSLHQVFLLFFTSTEPPPLLSPLCKQVCPPPPLYHLGIITVPPLHDLLRIHSFLLLFLPFPLILLLTLTDRTPSLPLDSHHIMLSDQNDLSRHTVPADFGFKGRL